MGLMETENWIGRKIETLEKFADADETEIPFCTDTELWRSAPKWKYFSNPTKANIPGARCQKSFDTEAAANTHLAEKAKGAVVKVPGEVKACGYCPVAPICSQRKMLFPD